MLYIYDLLFNFYYYYSTCKTLNTIYIKLKISKVFEIMPHKVLYNLK